MTFYTISLHLHIGVLFFIACVLVTSSVHDIYVHVTSGGQQTVWSESSCLLSLDEAKIQKSGWLGLFSPQTNKWTAEKRRRECKDDVVLVKFFFFFFSSRRRHTRCSRDWSSDVCSSD